MELFEYVAYSFATKKLRSVTIESHLSAIKFFHRISRGFELDTTHPVLACALKRTVCGGLMSRSFRVMFSLPQRRGFPQTVSRLGFVVQRVTKCEREGFCMPVAAPSIS